MNTQWVQLLTIILIFAVLLSFLYMRATKISESTNVILVDSNDTNSIYVACKVEDQRKRGAKVLMVLHSLICRSCESTNVYVDLSENKQNLDITCKKCGYVTRIPIGKFFI